MPGSLSNRTNLSQNVGLIDPTLSRTPQCTCLSPQVSLIQYGHVAENEILIVQGHDVCIGKQLGLLETRFVTSAIVHKYNLRYAEGQTGERFLEGNKDTGTLTVAPLNVVFTPRKA